MTSADELVRHMVGREIAHYLPDRATPEEVGPVRRFSNAGLDNPWRQVGFKTMQAEVGTHGGQIREFVHVDATMPPLHYAMCGCTGLPGYPQRWR